MAPVVKALAEMSIQDLRSEARRLGMRLGREIKFRSLEEGMEAVRAARRDSSKVKPGGSGTIRERAEEILMRPIPYSTALEELKEHFPEASTSRSSLRWYVAQMKRRGVLLPKRPIDHPSHRRSSRDPVAEVA